MLPRTSMFSESKVRAKNVLLSTFGETSLPVAAGQRWQSSWRKGKQGHNNVLFVLHL